MCRSWASPSRPAREPQAWKGEAGAQLEALHIQRREERWKEQGKRLSEAKQGVVEATRRHHPLITFILLFHDIGTCGNVTGLFTILGTFALLCGLIAKPFMSSTIQSLHIFLFI